MMKSLFFLFLLFPIFLNAQVTVQWSNEKTVSQFSDNSPKLALLGDGSPVAVWGSGSNIFFSKLVADDFTPQEILPNAGNSPDIYSFGGVDLAVQGDKIFVVFENFNDGVFLIRSEDGGETFIPAVNVYNPVPGKWATLPSVEVDPTGNPLVSVILENTNETEGEYILVRSLDGGQTFEAPVVASEPADGDYVCECCPSDILANGDDVWLIFRNNDFNLRDMWVSKSTDGGATFTEATDVDNTNWMINACPISGPKFTPMLGDSLLTVWSSGAIGPNAVYFSTINGTTMEKGYERRLPITNVGSGQANPAVAGQNDTIGIAWEEGGFGTNVGDIQFLFSTTGADGILGTPVNITEGLGYQEYPSLAYKNGVFHILYTSGNGGLRYKSGVIGEWTNTDVLLENDFQLSLLSNPIIGGKISLDYQGESRLEGVNISLFDLNGKLVQSWAKQTISSVHSLELASSFLPKGSYTLSVQSEEIKWARKLLILD